MARFGGNYQLMEGEVLQHFSHPSCSKQQRVINVFSYGALAHGYRIDDRKGCYQRVRFVFSVVNAACITLSVPGIHSKSIARDFPWSPQVRSMGCRMRV